MAATKFKKKNVYLQLNNIIMAKVDAYTVLKPEGRQLYKLVKHNTPILIIPN